MKRTISKMLGIAALAIAGITGSFIAATPAQAAYVPQYIPTGCNLVFSNSLPYPHQLQSTPTTTGWYVYCGADFLKFTDRAGAMLRTLPTSTPQPQIRQKFQAANYVLYVFTNDVQAQSKTGSAFVAAASGSNVGGYHQGDVIAGNPIQTPYIAIFEQVKQPNGSYLPYPNIGDPNDNLLFNFDSTLRHETGHAIDKLAGTTTNGSESAQFQTFISADRTWFNSINGCKNSGWENVMWGSAKTTICLNGQKRVGAPGYYSTKTNLQIVREFDPSAAHQQYFKNAPTVQEKREMFAELIQSKRAGGNNGPSFVVFDGWLRYIYYCGVRFTDYRYTDWALLPTASCTRPALTTP